MVRVIPHRVGDIFPVRSVPGGYPLPDGLPEGSMVRVIAFDHAYRLDTGLDEVRYTRKR